MNIIVAITKNYGIGFNGNLLVSIPEDLAFFRSKTLNKVVVMGHSTLKSLPNGKPLKNRVNIVLSSDSKLKIDGAIVCHSIDDVLDAAKPYNTDDVFIIGGQSVYEQMLDYCTTAYITRFNVIKKADKFFPMSDIEDTNKWKLKSKSEIKYHNNIGYAFEEYKKI